jgi:hypothetical protein
MPRRASVSALSPDEDEPQETAVDIAIEVLNAVAEDPLMRGSYRQRAWRYLNKIRRADQKARHAADEDEGEEDEF